MHALGRGLSVTGGVACVPLRLSRLRIARIGRPCSNRSRYKILKSPMFRASRERLPFFVYPEMALRSRRFDPVQLHEILRFQCFEFRAGGRRQPATRKSFDITSGRAQRPPIWFANGTSSRIEITVPLGSTWMASLKYPRA